MHADIDGASSVGEVGADAGCISESSRLDREIGISRVLGYRKLGGAGLEVDGLRSDPHDCVQVLTERICGIQQRSTRKDVLFVNFAKLTHCPPSIRAVLHLARVRGPDP